MSLYHIPPFLNKDLIMFNYMLNDPEAGADALGISWSEDVRVTVAMASLADQKNPAR